MAMPLCRAVSGSCHALMMQFAPWPGLTHSTQHPHGAAVCLDGGRSSLSYPWAVTEPSKGRSCSPSTNPGWLRLHVTVQGLMGSSVPSSRHTAYLVSTPECSLSLSPDFSPPVPVLTSSGSWNPVAAAARCAAAWWPCQLVLRLLPCANVAAGPTIEAHTIHVAPHGFQIWACVGLC